MQRFSAGVSALLLSVVVCATASAQEVTTPFAAPAARSHSGNLTPPSTASPTAVVAQFLRAQGRDAALIPSLVETSRGPARAGITQARFEQRVGGLPVYGTYAKAAVAADGVLRSLVENVVVPPAAIVAAGIGEPQAIAAAVANLYPNADTSVPGFFRAAPRASRVAIPKGAGAMSVGFVVQTWTERGNQLHETLVDGNGAILGVESRTSNDTYFVFTKNPSTTPQQLVAGPGAGNAQSPIGWLAGTQGSTHIRGNNANTYLDAVSDNASDGDGIAIVNGEFLTAADLASTPSSSANREVAVQNLFYLNNVMHDELYRFGFVEAVGNFQNDNFANGGAANDAVNAEAQDGGGTDNANFATPPDGQAPRMQMYLWTGVGTHEVVVNSTNYLAQGATFGPALTTTGVTGALALVNDGVGTTSDGCERLPRGSLTGRIALVDRGTCDFVDKVKYAQSAGAIGVIVANNQGGDAVLTMGGTGRTGIPAVLVSQNAGVALKTAIGASATERLRDPQPLQIDGDVDSDIVFHEYCHGLTWRMIGSMSGPMAGAVGEGMSDVCALMMNGDDRVGEYSASDAIGIRRDPYAAYPRTYGDFAGASVHDDGEIYAAIGWRLMELFGEAGRDTLFSYLVQGMNYTPAGPTYEQMRDGILQAVSIGGGTAAATCNVWQAFAQFGVGEGAQATVRGKRVTIRESFIVPASVCQ
jgi:extracellular elastinolytic metalloproteinase